MPKWLRFLIDYNYQISQQKILFFHVKHCKMNKNTHGGKRENAGRKPNGRKQHSIWCKPENISKIRKWIKENDY